MVTLKDKSGIAIDDDEIVVYPGNEVENHQNLIASVNGNYRWSGVDGAMAN